MTTGWDCFWFGVMVAVGELLTSQVDLRAIHLVWTLKPRTGDGDRLGMKGGYQVDPACNICLSQRLSHASLSISFCTVKLRMAH